MVALPAHDRPPRPLLFLVIYYDILRVERVYKMAYLLIESMGLFLSRPMPINTDIYIGKSLGSVLKTLRLLKSNINIIPLKEDDVYQHKPTLSGVTITYDATTTRVKRVFID